MMRRVTMGVLRFRVDLPVAAAGRRRRRRRLSERRWCLRRVFLTWARRWQVDAQQVYRWRNRDGVTHGRPIRRNEAAEPAFVPIVTDATSVGEAAPAVLVSPVIEVRLAGAVVRVVSGLDDAQLTVVLRAVRASALRA
jgi:transposase